MTKLRVGLVVGAYFMFVRPMIAGVLLLVSEGSALTQDRARTPVLVELFTSEGCSSCPPADALLARLDREQPVAGAEVIVLGEHVDYWDSLGWRDRFSSHGLTERQSGYGARFHLADVYTPQMVVAGRTQINGADAGAAMKAIQQAVRASGLRLDVRGAAVEGGHVTATVSAASPRGDAADLFAAVVSPVESTQVRSGENGGRTLRHVGVVRSLMRVGSVRDLARGPVPIRVALPDSGPGTRLVVFAQAAGFGPVLGAVSVDLPSVSEGAAVRAGK